MEIIFEIVFGFLAELFLAVFGEALAEFGLHAISEAPNTRPWRRVLVGFLYAAGAVGLGILSLQFFPLLVFQNCAIPVLHFVFSPILAGLALCFVSWAINRGINQTGFFQLQKFVYGVTFALSFSVTRALFG
jgi:hypothetical protein